MENILTDIAIELGYTQDEVKGGIMFSDRKARREHPPGYRDGSGRFYADEETTATICCRRPSVNWPWSQAHAARTADHCAELCDFADVTHVRRIGRAYDTLLETGDVAAARKTLVKGVKARLAARAAELLPALAAE